MYMVPPVLATMIFLLWHFKKDFDCACIFGVFDEDISSRLNGIRSPISFMAPRLLRAYTRLRFYRSWSYLFFAINLDLA